MRYALPILFWLAAALPALAVEPLVYRGEQTLFQDTTWEGEVLIDGILTVAPEVTLEIRPGTRVRFTPMDSNGDGIGEHEIFIQGVLKATGTAEQPILFTAAGPDPQPGAWGAVNMMASEEMNRLKHCIVEYAYRGFHAHFTAAEVRHSLFRKNVRGLQFQESKVTIADCRVMDNLNGLQFRDSEVVLADTAVTGNYWGVRCVYSEVALRGCRIEGNLVNGANLRDSTILAEGNVFRGNRRGLYLQRSRGKVRSNLLLESSEYGIFLEDSDCHVSGNRVENNGRAGAKWVNSKGDLVGNSLEGNGGYALVNDGAGPANARGNWWGTADPAEIATLVRDGVDRPGAGKVDFADPLAEIPKQLKSSATGKISDLKR